MADEAPLVDALRGRGLDARPTVWDDPDVDWSGAAVTVIRTAWDYTDRRDDFLAWVERVATVTDLWNPPAVVRWNTHKSYLRDLERRGVPVVPTIWLEAGTPVDVPALLAEHGWQGAVMKPAVSAGARDTIRVTDPRDGQVHADLLLADRDAMVQPYLRHVEDEGELSLLYVERQLTHAVRKVPASGDFRVQEEFGGRFVRVEPADDELAVADAVLDAVAHDLLYARVDLIRSDDDRPLLVELEAVEPSLYFTHAPDAAERLADAIEARVRASAEHRG